MTRTLADIRARAREHEQEILSLRWFTPAELAERWRFKSLAPIYAIPASELPYKEFGNGKIKRRRYRDDHVRAFEEACGASADV